MLARKFKGRMEALTVIMFLVIFALFSRLGYLQIAEGEYYSKLADGNRIRLIPAMAPRGLFYDRNGALMVSNRPGFTVSLLPLSGPVSDDVVSKLSVLLSVKKEDIYNKVKQHTAFDPIHIKSDVGPEIVTVIEEKKDEYPGVVIEIQPIRNYVNNEFKELE